MMKKTFLSLILIVLSALMPNLYAQDITAEKASTFGKLGKPIIVPSISQQIKDGTFIGVDANEEQRLGHPKKRGANINVPGKGFPKGDDPLVNNQRSAVNHLGREPSLVFDANVSSSTPSDPTGAVGPNHYIGAWNTSFRIFDKEGNPLTSTASLSTLFPGNAIGDPIVFYDAEAERFVITEFDSSPNGFNVAICQGTDPVNDGWYVYTSGFGTGIFPDYTKFSVWSDGYYVTANINASNRVFAIERDSMLVGADAQFVAFPLPGIATSGFYSPQFFNVTDDNLPPAGNASVVYMQDDSWSGVATDHVKIWTVDVDWEDISNSTISSPQELQTSAFTSVFDGGSFSNVPQPSGPDQDVLQATIMNQAQYRRFDDYNSAIFNFVVDTDGSGGELAGIRWFELRQDNDGDPWTIYQEGTYISPNNDKHAFSGSMVMDGLGNIGMGYTTCSQNEKIAIYYTGRFAADPLGQMTIEESLIAQSTSNNSSNRLADYVQLSLDPSNDKTFWHIAEYFVSNQRRDVVGVFQIASDFINDVGVTIIDEPNSGELSDSEIVTVSIFNYGEDEQSNIPVSYMVDGANIVNEILAGPVPSGSTMQYTFSATADLSNVGATYQIIAYTGLESDEEHNNDTITKSVTYYAPNDIGVSRISTPISGYELTGEEEITVIIQNYGTNDQSNFEVTYNLDDNMVTEQVDGPLTMDNPITYTFDQTGDFSALGFYHLEAYTSMPDDSNLNNDTTYVEIIKTMCEPESNCSPGTAIYLFQLGTIDNGSDCSEGGYSDFTDLSTFLTVNSSNDLTITTHYGNLYVKAWIDFNDNFIYEDNEVVVDNYLIAPGQGSGDYTETMELVVPDGVNLGEHLLRVKTNFSQTVPDDACEGTNYGETEDYLVEIELHTGVNNNPLSNSDMIVKSKGNNQFEISLQSTQISESLIINLHNILGQKLVENRVENINGKYVYNLNLSYAKPGAYIVRLGSAQYGKVKRIIVK